MQDANRRSQLLRLPEVLKILRISRSSFYEGMALDMYPRPIRLGKRTVAWLEHEIYGAIEALRDR